MANASYSFERYLNVRMAYNPSFSPDGKRLSFLTTITGVAEVWSVPIDNHAETPAWPTQLTFRGERVLSATFSPTEDILIVEGDVGGSELSQLYMLNADSAAFTGITERPSVIHGFGGWSPDGKRITYASNERDARYFDVYESVPGSGQSRFLLCHDGTNYARRYSPDGRYVLAERQDSNVHSTLLLLDTTTGECRTLTPEASETSSGSALYVGPAWSADRRGLYVLSNRGQQFTSLAWLDLATTELTYLRDDIWDAEHLAVTEDGTYLALVSNEDGYSRLELFDVADGWQGRHSLPVPELPKGVIYELKWSPDGRQLALVVCPANDAIDVWVWDRVENILWRATRSSLGGIPRETFVSPSLIRYPSFDGREIPAFLYLPREQEPRNLPFVIDVHGGPEGQSRPLFDAVTQYLVACGYGVFVPNVRGSTGYGYEYQSLDDVRLRMNSVADLQHGVFWLRDSGIADPQRIAVMGGSYGGFMVLSCVTTYPDLWAAGVDIVGIANFVTFLENTGPWRRKLREPEYGSLENDREFLEQISPIHSVERITAPLFVVHGANDPRVPIGEAEQIVGALRTRNVPVEYLRFEDEGHGLVKRANMLVAYPAIARFLDRHVRGDKEKSH